jgi:parvulin-like peptidyl-prolyl isomerase
MITELLGESVTKKIYTVRKYLWIFVLGSLFTVTACTPSCNKREKQGGREKAQGITDGVAALVNGVKINKSDLDSLHKRAADKYLRAGRPFSPDLDQRLRASFLRKMIDDELFRQRSQDEGVKVDRFERVEGFEKYKKKIGGQRVFEIYLQKEDLTEEQVQKIVLFELQRDKLIAKLSPLPEPTPQEIASFYQTNERQYIQPEMVHARHILLKLDPKDGTEKVETVKKKAMQILKEALGPNASFVELAQKYSEGPSAKTGGDLGNFGRGHMVKEFEDLAFSSPLKTPVGPIRTDFGYHIVYIEEKLPPRPAPLDHVRDRVVETIKRNKRGQKSEELLLSMRKSADVKINDHSMTQDDYK